MRQERKNKRGGFTLVETLLTIAITVVLLAISILGVGQLRSRLKITELDNAAREIYMAAQNRAVLLNNRGALQPLVVKTGGSPSNLLQQANGTSYYYISTDDTDLLAQLLPDGTIDPALMDGTFYIVYEPAGASVTDVFFMEKAGSALPGHADFTDYYANADRAKEARRKASPMVGWYNGDPAEGGDAVVLRTPDIVIHNEDILWVEVKWWVPAVLFSHANDVKLELTLTYSDTEIKLTDSKYTDWQLRSSAPQTSPSYITHTDTYLLDSMVEGQQFKDLLDLSGTGFTLGGDFTITATVSADKDAVKGVEVIPGVAAAADNSLFAKGTDAATARIGYMRHLQNLYAEHSHAAATITKAEQIADIENPSIPNKYTTDGPLEGTDPYNFKPIVNEDLKEYDGQEKEIRRLYIETSGSAGLFKEFKGTSGGNKTLTGIRLLAPEVSGGGGTDDYTGTLCADMEYVTVSDCQTYWELDDLTQPDLRYLLGEADGGTYAVTNKDGGGSYTVTGNIVGGLIGRAQNVTIEKSSASVTAKGNTCTGGLVGRGEKLTVTGSYADCYLAGNKAAGLAGDLGAGTNTFKNVYTAGFIHSEPGEYAAGLYLGSGAATVTDSYAAMGYNQVPGGESSQSAGTVYPLSDHGNYGADVYYLAASFMGKPQNGGTAVDSAELTRMARGTSTEHTISGFVRKGVSSTEAYNLQADMALLGYPYPGIQGMTHYGDWPDILQVNSLIYWEQYEDDTSAAGLTVRSGSKNGLGIYGGNIRRLRTAGGDPLFAVDDGYAVVLAADEYDEQLETSGSISITFVLDGGTPQTVTYQKDGSDLIQVETTVGGVEGTYYLALLPQDLVDLNDARTEFYHKLQVTPSGATPVSNTYYYDPHFAATTLPEEDASPERPERVFVRTARHLYYLSQYPAYYNNAFAGYLYLQQLDIDYWKYRFTDHGMSSISQHPIGRTSPVPFSEQYNGGRRTIQNVPLTVESTDDYVGLFGYSTGAIESTFYLGGQYTEEQDILTLSAGVDSSGQARYAGGLCGYSTGTIRNCAVGNVAMTLTSYNYGVIYAGGLVGANDGQITQSSAAIDGVTLDSTDANAYLGGFAGRCGAGSVIDGCYAVGRIDAKKSSRSEQSAGVVQVAGFAALCQGTISSSYSAVGLTLSGGSRTTPFCPAATINCYYLNHGNFLLVHPTTGEGDIFTVQYQARLENDNAAERTWDQFIAKSGTEDALVDSLGLTFGFGQSGDPYQFPESVADASGKRHFGVYITQIELNQLGVFYWEHETGGNEGYKLSAVIINDTDESGAEFSELDTLCESHADGGVIDQFGYGYFYTGSADPLQSPPNTEFSEKEDDVRYTQGDSAPAVKNAAYRIAQLMPLDAANPLTFVAYTTCAGAFDPAKPPKTYLTGDNTADVWTFQMDGKEYKFYVNPFFADAFGMQADGLVFGLERHKCVPGGEDLPYGVRSVAQLQLINWNYENKNTNTAINSAETAAKFPFLNHVGDLAIRCWKQSHDLQRMGSAETPHGTPLSPIAAMDSANTGTEEDLHGWFGGSYDGGEYSIKEVSITDPNACVGLFGVTYNAQLKDIVMYSPSGAAYVERSGDTADNASWYALGGLVGLAAVDANADYKIENCSVAGYRIRDLSATIGFGGAGVGGLLGICNMALSHCSAVTDIEISFTHSVNDPNTPRNVRVGGLVGSCQQSVANSYSGGSITVAEAIRPDKKLRANDYTWLHVGGICGGDFIKPLKIENVEKVKSSNSANVFRNCYTYVELPDNLYVQCGNNSFANANSNHDHLYAIGGIAELMHSGTGYYSGVSSVYENCYYLTDTTGTPRKIEKSGLGSGGAGGLPQSEAPDVITYHFDETFSRVENSSDSHFDTDIENKIIGISYDQLAGGGSITKKDGTVYADIYAALAGDGTAAFAPVTTATASGASVPGRYSFPSSAGLQGLSYPFPTVLTMTDSYAPGGTARVHYGDWPAGGLERPDNSPLYIDLFSDYRPDGEAGSVPEEEDGSYSSYRWAQLWPADLLLSKEQSGVKYRVTVDGRTEDGHSVCAVSADGASGGSDEEPLIVELTDTAPPAPAGADKARDSLDWESTSEDPAGETVWQAKVHEKQLFLKIKGLAKGHAAVKVEYLDAEEKVIAEKTISVEVGAELRLAPRKLAVDVGESGPGDGTEAGPGDGTGDTLQSDAPKYVPYTEPVTLFNTDALLDLYPFGGNDEPIDTSTDLWKAVAEQLKLNTYSVDGQYIDSVQEAPLHKAADAAITLKLHGNSPTPQDQSVSLAANFTFTYNGASMDVSSTVMCNVRTLEASGEDLFFYPEESDPDGGGKPADDLAKEYRPEMFRFTAAFAGQESPDDITEAVKDLKIESAIGSASGEDTRVVKVDRKNESSVTVTPKQNGDEQMSFEVAFVCGPCRFTGVTIRPWAHVYCMDPTHMLLLTSESFVEGSQLVALSPGTSATVSIQSYLPDDGWTAEWKLEAPAGTDTYDPAQFFEISYDSGSRSCTVTAKIAEGLGSLPDTPFALTVTVTLADKNGTTHTLTGRVDVQIMNPSTPTPEPTEDPTSTPDGDPEGDPDQESPGFDDPTASPETSTGPTESPAYSPDVSASPEASTGPTESPQFSPQVSPETSLTPVEPSASPDDTKPTESPQFSPSVSPDASPTPVEPSTDPDDTKPTESPQFSPPVSPDTSPTPVEPTGAPTDAPAPTGAVG